MLLPYLALFLIYHTATFSVGQTALAMYRWRSLASWISAIAALLILACVTLGAAASVPGKNVAVTAAYLYQDRTQTAIAAAGFLSAVFVLLCLNERSSAPRIRVLSWATYLCALAAVSSIMFKEYIGAYLPDTQRAAGAEYLLAGQVAKGFVLEEAADLQLAPTSMAFGPDGNLFITGYAGVSYQNGRVIKLAIGPTGAGVEEVVASYLNRPHGIAFWNGDMYVSRAGQYMRAVDGKIVQENTGAVTRLRDLDGDGNFDNYVDVLSDLPGAQQPDGLHQNNGIAFDQQGHLYVTVGSPSDHWPSPIPYAGTILRAAADGTDVKVFAKGFRNPFGIAVGPQDQVFCTDNDASSNAGDKLIHVKQGQHYGHPYDSLSRTVEVKGAVKPLLLWTSAQGLTYVPPGALKPGFDDSLYLASFGDGVVYRVVLTPKEETFEARLEFFAKVPEVLCMAVSPSGDLYAASHTLRKLYRIRPQ